MSDISKYNETPLYDLQEVIQQYRSQPELLKLILSSKVEEDKRRAEEAKLRAKELDLYSHKMLPSANDYHKQPRPAPYTIPKSRTHNHSSSISSASSSSSSLSFEEDNDQRRHSAAAAMLAMGGTLIEETPAIIQQRYTFIHTHCTCQ